MNSTRILDCLVVGAGPAGLTAAVYLRRFQRQVLVVDHGHSRALYIERSHNYPGFPQGIAGAELLQRLREQLRDVKGELLEAEVTALHRMPHHGFAAQWGGTTAQFRTVLLATGVLDTVPPLPGVEEVQRHGLLRQCPICDGYEHRGQRILVLGDGQHAAREAAFIADYSPWVAHAGLAAVPAGQPGVRGLPAPAVRLQYLQEGGVRVVLSDGALHDFDVAYGALHVRPRSHLGRALGAEVDALGSLITDEHAACSVAGLYAAGDVVPGLDQLVVAASQGSVAATAIHNRLREQTP